VKPPRTPAATLRLRRSLAGVLVAGAVLTGTGGVIGAGIALSAGPAAAGPAEDCAAKDDYGDQITMRKGIELYDQYGESLTQQQLHQGIIEAMDEMQQAQSQGRDVPQIRSTK
jgi:hypothetical protein